MLKPEQTLFVLVDVQGKLAQIMYERDALFDNLLKLVKGIRVLNIPIVWMEQNPEKMGATIPELAELLQDLCPMPKMSFGACGDGTIMDVIESSGRKQILVAGIEAHVCVYQTARGLHDQGYDVEVVSDAVSSRTATNRDGALRRLQQCGVSLTTVEMALFELLGTAEHAAFRDFLKIVR